MGRISLVFAKGVKVYFANRDRALEQIRELANRGTRFPLVIYGPEGCGKTALLRQASILLNELGYHVVYISPLEGILERAIWYTPAVKDIVKEVLKTLNEPVLHLAEAILRIGDLIIRRLEKPRVALIVDDVFQAIGLRKAEAYVKALLNLIEYPPSDYENIIVLLSSSEGLTRDVIGRHRWARITGMWNMDKNGFKELYTQIPGDKPPLNHLWQLTGGNPWILARLYEVDWNYNMVISQLARERGIRQLVKTITLEQKSVLSKTIEDPDTLWENLGDLRVQELLRKLVELNMVMELWDRSREAWIDTPPPLKDLELGIGEHIAWQTPLHREAVRMILGQGE